MVNTIETGIIFVITGLLACLAFPWLLAYLTVKKCFHQKWRGDTTVACVTVTLSLVNVSMSVLSIIAGLTLPIALFGFAEMGLIMWISLLPTPATDMKELRRLFARHGGDNNLAPAMAAQQRDDVD
jgi:hypothetical protein